MREYEKGPLPRVVLYKRRQRIPLSWGTQNRFYEIISGGVKLCGISPLGEEVLIDVAVAGDFIEMPAVTSLMNEELVITLVDTQLMIHYIPEDAAENRSVSLVVSRYIKYLAEQNSRYRQRMINTGSSAAAERLNYVYELYDIEIKDSLGASYRLIDLLSYKELGYLSGVTRQTAKKHYQNFLKNKCCG